MMGLLQNQGVPAAGGQGDGAPVVQPDANQANAGPAPAAAAANQNEPVPPPNDVGGAGDEADNDADGGGNNGAQGMSYFLSGTESFNPSALAILFRVFGCLYGFVVFTLL